MSKCLPVLTILLVAGVAHGETKVDRYGDPLPDGALMRLGTVRQRVAATQIAFREGRTFVTAAAGRVVSIWDADSGKIRRRHRLPGACTDRFWLSPDGRLLAVYDRSRLEIFDTDCGERKYRLDMAPPTHLAFRPDGKGVATDNCLTSPYQIVSWNFADGKGRFLSASRNLLLAFAFSPDGKRLYAAVDNHSLHCWDVQSGKEVWQNDHWASHFVVAPDGRTLCTAGYQQGGLHLWDAGTGRRLGGGEFKQRESIGPLAFAPDGRTVVLTNFKDVLFWDVADKTVRRRLPGAGSCFAVAPDGKSVVSVRGALLRRWDIASGRALYPDTAGDGHTAGVRALAYAPDGRSVVTESDDGTIRSWRLSGGQPRTVRARDADRLGFLLLSTGSETVKVFRESALSFTPDGRRLIVTEEGQLGLLDLDSGKEIRCFEAPVADTKNQPGPLLTANDRFCIGAARLSADGRTLWGLTQHAPPVTGGFVGLEGQKETLIAWDVATGRVLSARPVSCNLMAQHLISPDGRSVVLEDGQVRDVASDRFRLHTALEDDLGALLGLPTPRAFSADSRLLARAAGSEGKRIAVYELLSGSPLVRVDAIVNHSSHFTFSPDGRLLLAAGADALHVWEVSTGRRLLHLPTEGRLTGGMPRSFATCLEVGPDGQSAATGHEDGTVMVWDLAPAWRRLADRPTALADAQLDACWSDLLSNDPRPAYAAMDRLRADPARAVGLLRKRLRPVTIDRQWLNERIAELDSDEYTVRERATRQLEAVAEVIAPRLKRELENKPTLEMRRRLLGLLALAPAPASPRQLRAVALLEQMATPEARKLLRELADGERGARLTAAARDALARLAARPAGSN